MSDGKTAQDIFQAILDTAQDALKAEHLLPERHNFMLDSASRVAALTEALQLIVRLCQSQLQEDVR